MSAWFARSADFYRAWSLRCIAMEGNIVGGQHFGNARQILDRADFIVYGHDGRHENIVAESSRQVQSDRAFLLDRRRMVSTTKPSRFGDRARGGKDAFVLRLR